MLPFIDQLYPAEQGGIEAREGYYFQDQVAVGFCFSMLLGELPDLVQVWCEAVDDITLVFSTNGAERYECVQVKSDALNQLWSIARLCERDNGAGTSIAEKSIAKHVDASTNRFRLVTRRDVMNILSLLKLPITAPARANLNSVALAGSIREYIGDYQSAAGLGIQGWLEALLWDVRDSNEALEASNLQKLDSILHQLGVFLAPDQKQGLYHRVLVIVLNAARNRGMADPEQKKLLKDQLQTRITQDCQSIAYPTAGGNAQPMRNKMTSAGIAPNLIDSAAEVRLSFLQDMRDLGYLDLSQKRRIVSEVQSQLQRLLVSYDAGSWTGTGNQFYAHCLDQLQQARNGSPVLQNAELGFLYGCMYDLTNRCLHRFERYQP